MYVFIREATSESSEAVVFVQAKCIEDAKVMAGVPEAYSRWIVIADSMLGGFTDIKEGMIVREL